MRTGNRLISLKPHGLTARGDTGTDNITGVAPLLGPLANNGGPTLTHALLPGSPAINRGNPGIVSPPL